MRKGMEDTDSFDRMLAAADAARDEALRKDRDMAATLMETCRRQGEYSRDGDSVDRMIAEADNAGNIDTQEAVKGDDQHLLEDYWRRRDGAADGDSDVDVQRLGPKHAQWMSMFAIRMLSQRDRKAEPDLLLDAAQKVADSCLRKRVTMPANPSDANESFEDADSGGRLPSVSCAFRGCNWSCSPARCSKLAYEDDSESPWDQELRKHVAETHGETLKILLQEPLGLRRIKEYEWDIYKEALAVQERRSIPVTGASVERRSCEHTAHVYNDDTIRALICFACARVKVDTGRIRSKIKFCSGRWLFSLPSGSLTKNFSMREFSRRYRRSGTPLADRGQGAADLVGPDFTDWERKMHGEYLRLLMTSPERLQGICLKDLENLATTSLLCCPENHICADGCQKQGILCPKCRVPICAECRLAMQANEIIPHGLINDNWYGYVQAWIHEVGVTWMEKTVSSLYWTGMTLFSIGLRSDGRKTRRKHLMEAAMYSANRRVAFKGQVFSAPMDWSSMLEQLQRIETGEERVALPVLGEVLLARVRLSISAGLVDLNKHIKQATVRRDVVVQLIRMHRDSGDPDYAGINMQSVEKRAKELTPTDAPTIPNGLMDVLGEDSDEDLDDDMDKAATPAPRIWNEQELQKQMEFGRPQLLLAQRDSDAQKEVEASRINALGSVSMLQLRTGSNLLDQFQSSYIPRVFNLSLPWCVGMPASLVSAIHGGDSSSVWRCHKWGALIKSA